MEDSSDILGSPRPVVRDDYNKPILDISKSGSLTVAGGVIVLLLVLQLLYPYYRQYRERQYRKAVRRRHGIPDNDHRPFNVAYAAASQARLEKGKDDEFTSRRSSVRPSALATALARAGSIQAQSSRQRPVSNDPRQLQRSPALSDIPGALPRHESHVDSRRTSGNSTSVTEETDNLPEINPQNNIYSDGRPRRSSATPASRQAGTFRSDRRTGVSDIPASVPAVGKRGYDDGTETAQQGYKKSRVEGGELIDGDEDAVWGPASEDVEENMDVDARVESSGQRKRGAKRMTSHEEDEGFESGRGSGREKRQRKVSRLSSDDPMDEDEVPELVRIHRGKKRDRADAGSTFGEDGSSAESEGEGNQRRYRRRRISSQHKKTGGRGRKRDRELETDESGSEESDNQTRRPVRQRRGYGASHEEVFVEEDMLSNDPLCKGRRIGEEWEANGIHYRVGPNGQRLRQALVKRSRPRFPMPKDSEHHDRSVSIDVYVETWLSEEEYQAAKERHELAWQDTPRTRSVDLPSMTPQSPTKGKNLLWAPGKETSAVLSSGRTLKASATLPNINILRGSSLHKMDLNPPRRLSSFHSTTFSTPDSPARPVKTYSKWEKQDLEAAAMSKLREKLKKDTDKEKEIIPAITITPPSALPSTITFPSVSASNGGSSITKPAEQPATTPAPSTAVAPVPAIKPSATPFSFGQPPAVATSKASTSDLPTLTIPSSTTKPAEPAATKPATDQSKPAPALTLPGAPASASGFSFMKPAAVSATTASAPAQSAPAVAPAIMNIFGQPPTPASASTPASGGSSAPLNIFSAANKPAASTPAAPEPPKFSFGAPPEKKVENPAPVAPSTQASGGSLLSRMSGFVAPNPTLPATIAASPAPAPAFSFGKPATEAPASTPVPSAPAPATSAAPAPPKFSFGSFGSAPTGSTSTAGSTSATSTNNPKPATSAFSFGAPKSDNTAPAITPATSASTVATPSEQPAEKPKFSFGFGSGSSTAPVGNSSSSLAGALGGNNAQVKTETKPATFSFGAPAATGSSAPTGTPAFGVPATAPPASTGANGSVFGNLASGSKDTSKSAFTFGSGSTPTTTSVFGAPAASAETKPTSVFGSASTTPVFGATSNPAQSSTTAASSSAPAAGASAGPKFSFGSASSVPKPADGQAKFSFGNSSSTPNNPFNFSNAPSNGNATPSTPVFGATSGSQPPSNPFGAAASGSAPAFGGFSFGSAKSAGDSNKK